MQWFTPYVPEIKMKTQWTNNNDMTDKYKKIHMYFTSTSDFKNTTYAEAKGQREMVMLIMIKRKYKNSNKSNCHV